MLVRKQFVQQQEEEKIKEQQRRLAEERERMRREFESKFFVMFCSTNKFYLISFCFLSA
jgi:hypothetical protein